MGGSLATSFLVIVEKTAIFVGEDITYYLTEIIFICVFAGTWAFVFVFVVSTRFAGDAACPASYQICPKTGFQDAAIAAAVIIAIIAIIVIIAIIAFALGIVIMKIVIIFIVITMATT